MKTLILMRHGKSDWSGAVPDHDRPINHRGRLAAVQMAGWLSDTGLMPDHMLVSSAIRTRETADLLLSVWGEVAKVSHDSLYLAEPDTILGTIRAEGAGDILLVLGHNPGLEALATRLSRDSCPPAMPTCAVAALRFAVKRWGDADFGGATLLHHVTPGSIG